jgi:DNA-binding IclR family transcriptional regulator
MVPQQDCVVRIFDIPFDIVTSKLAPAREDRQVPSPPTERVIAVMQLLGADPDRVFSLADVSRQLGISRATGHAILTTLARFDWVVRDDAAGYSWGPAIAALARPVRGEFRPLLRELSEAVGAQAFLARREGASIVVAETVGESPTIGAGLRIPLVAPFGRDYVAWAGSQAIASWFGDEPSARLRTRLTAVLAEVRERGYVVERLSREYVRVYTALRALAADGEPDPIAARLAGAFADLTLVDVLPDELKAGPHQVATISAPIRDSGGTVVMSLTVAPFRELRAREIARIGSAVRRAAEQVEQRLA